LQGERRGYKEPIPTALKEAGDELAARTGHEPSEWHANANVERIHSGASFPFTMRWTNRPTFQQVISLSGHRQGDERGAGRRASARARPREPGLAWQWPVRAR